MIPNHIRRGVVRCPVNLPALPSTSPFSPTRSSYALDTSSTAYHFAPSDDATTAVLHVPLCHAGPGRMAERSTPGRLCSTSSSDTAHL